MLASLKIVILYIHSYLSIILILKRERERFYLHVKNKNLCIDKTTPDYQIALTSSQYTQ